MGDKWRRLGWQTDALEIAPDRGRVGPRGDPAQPCRTDTAYTEERIGWCPAHRFETDD